MSDIDRLDVHVDSVPDHGLIRSRIEAALAGRPAEPGPERALGEAVAAAVATAAATRSGAAGAGPGSGGPR